MLSDMLCPACLEVQSFEQAPCSDGHEADCPEWICTICGAAVFSGVSWSLTATAKGLTAKRSATRRRHAA